MTKKRKKKQEWHNILRESTGLVPRYYCNPAEEPEFTEEYEESTDIQDLKTVARYFISIGQSLQDVDEQNVYKILSKSITLYFGKSKRPLFLKAAATYIEQHQHHQFNLKDYRSQILKHTKQLIEEQKFKRE